MSKCLKALAKIKNALFNRNVEAQIIRDIDFAIIEKELKALEIIKKLFDKYDFELISSYEDGKPVYILRLGTKQRKRIFLLVLTKEEYDLLKEVLL